MRQKNLFALFFILLNFICLNTYSQNGDERCGTMEAVQERINNNPRYAQYYEWAHSIPGEQRFGQIPCDGTNTIVIPVAFHFAPGVVTCGDSDCLLAEVQDQLDAMNLAFGNNTGSAAEAVCPAAYQDANGNSVASTGSCISFCLATPPAGGAAGLDPACDPPITVGVFTGGINAGGGGAPGWGGILNLFIVSNANCLGVADGIPGAANGDGVSTCAAAFGGFDPSSGCGLDNEGTYNLGATMVHEIGHYLGLLHTHDDFGGSCTDYDTNPPGPFPVNDTPTMYDQYYGCPTGCVTNAAVGAPGGSACATNVIPTANFMAYTDDACMSMFTEDQAAVMNYWANQLFGNTAGQCSDPNPTVLTTLCENTTCVVACATEVTTPVAITEDFCETSIDAAFPDPEANGLVLDDNSDAVYTWSTGNYLSAGGAAIGAPNTLTSTNCSIETETYYLNIDCETTPLNPTLDGGTYIITVYPGPPADLTTLATASGENACTEPVLTPLAGCENFITVTPDAGNPTFPVNAGDSGTASYTVTFTPDPNGPDCCVMGNPDDEGEILVNGDFEAGVGPWVEYEEVPAGTPNPTPFGIIGVSGMFVNGTSEAWFGGWGGDSYLTITQDITIPACGVVELSFDYVIGVCGANTDYLEVQIGGVVVANIPCDDTNMTFGPIDVLALGVAPGATQIVIIGEENSGANTNFFVDNVSLVASDCTVPADCDVVITADYNCTDAPCTDCADPTCTTTIACDDMDCNTENDMETVLVSDNSVCVPCAGTPIPPPDCDDMDCNTTDSYDTATCTCVNDPITPPDCDDMDCNTTDSYDSATCTCVNDPIPPPDCDDMDCNTADSYDTATCTCVNDPITPPDCDDMDCTTDDSYDTATCTCINDTIPPPDCDDGDCNTADVYNTATCLCENNPITPEACDDMDCTTDDSYDDVNCVCINAPIPPPDCDDGDCNTDDSYDTATCVCVNDPITPPDCDDMDCSTDDSYDTATCTCINDPITPPDCDDMDCNTDDSYDTATCTCINDPITPPDCDDGDCNTADVYNTATCMCENNPIEPGACDDGDCNTDDSYDDVGCVCVNTPIPPPDPNDNCEFTDDSYDAATCTVINTPNCPAGTTFNAATCSCDDDGPCMDAITGNVSVDEPTCSLAGVQVIILDSTGTPVAGSPVTIDANGDYFLAGPFPCGSYTAELDLTTLPSCYNELEGDTGPIGFTVDGDGEADGANFSNNPMVPTLSQWGLFILALLLMSFGAIKVAQLNSRFVKRHK